MSENRPKRIIQIIPAPAEMRAVFDFHRSFEDLDRVAFLALVVNDDPPGYGGESYTTVYGGFFSDGGQEFCETESNFLGYVYSEEEFKRKFLSEMGLALPKGKAIPSES